MPSTWLCLWRATKMHPEAAKDKRVMEEKGRSEDKAILGSHPQEALTEAEWNGDWDVIVVGGGVIGLWSALYLARSGAKVLVLDGGTSQDCCSMGNAGLLAPSRCKPLPEPGRIREGIAGMFSSSGCSPGVSFGLDPDLWGWLLRFALHCRRSPFQKGSRILLEMGLQSLELMEAEFGQEEEPFPAREGVLYPYFQRMAWVRAVHQVRSRQIPGLEAELLSPGEAREAEPGLAPSVLGAVLQERDRRTEPERLMSRLQEALHKEGVRMLSLTRVYALDAGLRGGVQRVRTTCGSLRAKQVLLAAGSGTRDILHSLGLWLPLRAGTGWSISFSAADPVPKRGMLLEEARVGITPWAGGFRVTGGLELSGREKGIRRLGLQGVLRRARSLMPGLDYSGRPRIWRGNRPLTPDGLPVVGRMPGAGNVWVASGHANLGLTLGAASGSRVAEAMGGFGKEPIHALAPDRFLRD
ncbi:MAG: FAD-binding oxidoreductase [Desulfohalobiaceae bacterium]|nr:FAD-binding oxidoreductase [Desulfohalobiaceae bacterium]